LTNFIICAIVFIYKSERYEYKNMKKTLAIIVKGVLFSLIPAIFTLLGTINTLNNLQVNGYIGEAVDIETLKSNFSIIGVFLTFALLTTNLIIHEMEEGKYKRQSQQLIKYNKDILINGLAESLGKEYCNIDIRIFVPEKTLWWKVKYLFNKNVPLLFSIKNIEGLAEAGLTNNLKFQVSPSDNVQGLVGKCYQNRKIIYDDNLKETNSKEYNLTDFQKSKTSDLKFIIVCPIFNKDRDIDAIVAFDCKHEIKINHQEDKFVDAILSYTQQLYEYVPEIFKKKGGMFK